MSQAAQCGKSPRFKVLYYAKESEPEALEEELGRKEGEMIRNHLPPLNYQIPKEENWRCHMVNPSAQTIKLSEIFSE